MASSSPGDEVFASRRLILVTGGARSGKSRFAQRLGGGRAYRSRAFLATAVACDGEMAKRISRHRRDRDGRCAEARGGAGAGRWTTLEEPIRLPERIPARLLRPGNFLLLDCLPTLLTNWLLQGWSPTRIERQVERLLGRLRRPGLTAVMVSNEVGLGVVPEASLGRQFRDLLGAVNQRAARRADEVYLLVAGIPVRLK